MGKHVTVSGNKALVNMLKQLPKAVVRLNRQAVTKSMQPMLSASKANCPVHHNHLKKSLIKKIANNGAVAYGVIGADKDYIASAESGERIKGSNKEETKMLADAARQSGGVIRPSKYDHLVEYGHQNPDGSMTLPNPFLQDGFDDGVDAAQAIYETSIVDGIENQAAKLGLT